MPRPTTKCRRCARPVVEHDSTNRCPDGAGVLLLHTQKCDYASVSLNGRQLQILDHVLTSLRSRSELTIFTRVYREELQDIQKLLENMRASIDARKGTHDEQGNDTESSAGHPVQTD